MGGKSFPAFITTIFCFQMDVGYEEGHECQKHRQHIAVPLTRHKEDDVPVVCHEGLPALC